MYIFKCVIIKYICIYEHVSPVYIYMYALEYIDYMSICLLCIYIYVCIRLYEHLSPVYIYICMY